MYPKIYLSIDNCFASKRWTTPSEWSKVISSLGVYNIEASADTELDPLFMGRDYLKKWVEEAKTAEKVYGVRIPTLFSGHGTYSTLGLTHSDKSVRRRMVENWFKPLISIAAELEAGMGFYAHAFSQSVLEDPVKYQQNCAILEDELCELNVYGKSVGCKFLALEQMYTPHQIPWTIPGTQDMIQNITAKSGVPFYFTEDVGHHLVKYLMPTKQQLQELLGAGAPAPWLGNEDALALYEDARGKGACSEAVCQRIIDSMLTTPYMFAEAEDGDCYQWIRKLGAYSPIIHLQQTDGRSSDHLPFSAETNAKGIISGEKILRTIKESYDRPAENGMPEKVKEIYLTLEVFSGTSQFPHIILENYRKTVQYWRQYIPEDGIFLDELIKNLQ